jgi:hypothetical protein
MATLAGKMKKPEPNKKKIAIIIAVVAVVCVSTSAGLYFVFRGGPDDRDEFGRRGPRFHDANLPKNLHEQSYDEITAYKNSDKYKKLSQREQMMYSMMTFRQEADHRMETYFTIPKEQQTAYLDKVIDEMQENMKKMEQMRSQFPRPERRRDANEPNDPNRMQRMQERMAQRNNPSNARSRSERGTALQRAQRTQFMAAMQKRMKERGIKPPQFGGGRGGFGGGPGGGGPGGGR